MRIVVLCSSPYSETGCAVVSRLVRSGRVPVGVLTLPAWDRRTLLRKLSQWGIRDSFAYGWMKLGWSGSQPGQQLRNPYLQDSLQHESGVFRSLHNLAKAHSFPVVTCPSQNSARAVAQVQEWAPELVVFTGGNILRQDLLQVPRLGVLNAHLALLPEIRGMSSPEWSLLYSVPLGITIHLMDSGVDTGPVLLRHEFQHAGECESLSDVRNRMIAEGIELLLEAIAGLEQGTLAAVPQTDRDQDRQFFVMHEQLKAEAARRLRQMHIKAAASGIHD